MLSTKTLLKYGISVVGTLVFALFLAGCREQRRVEPREPTLTGSRSDPPQIFTPKWQTNRNYAINLYLDQSTQVRIRRTDEDLPVDVRMRLDFNGNATNAAVEGRQTLVMDLTGLMFQLIRGENPVVYYDTASRIPQLEDDQRTTEALDKLPGNVQWRFTLAKDGQVVGADADMKQAKQALDHPSKPAGLTTIKRLFAPQFFRHFLELNMLPKTAVKVGDSWPIERMLTAGTAGVVLFQGKCTFRGWQQNLGKQCARFDYEGEVGSPTNSARGILKMARNNSPLVESGNMEGTLWFDPVEGIPTQMVADLTVLLKPAVRPKKVAATVGTLPPGPDSTNAPTMVTLQEPVEPAGAPQYLTPVHQRMKLKIMDLSGR